MKRKQPFKLKVRRNPKTGAYVSLYRQDESYAHRVVYRVTVDEHGESGVIAAVDKREFAAWPSIPWEEVPLRVRKQFKKMVETEHERRDV